MRIVAEIFGNSLTRSACMFAKEPKNSQEDWG